MLFWSKKIKNKERNRIEDIDISQVQTQAELTASEPDIKSSNTFAAMAAPTTPILQSGCNYPLSIANQFPTWVSYNKTTSEPNLVDLIQEYYNWLTCGTKQNLTPTFGFFELESLSKTKDLPKQLLSLYSEIYVPSLPKDALNGDVSETELRSLINAIYNKLYVKKGSEYSFKYLIALFFGVQTGDVSIIYPKRYLMTLNAGSNNQNNSNIPFDTVGRLNYSILRDSTIWNEYVYIINVKNSGDSIDRTRFEKLIRPMLHPVGLKDYYQEQKEILSGLVETYTVITKEIPKINNYYFYNLFSQTDLDCYGGCTYSAPDNVATYAFPSWSTKIPMGVSFGSININDFWELEPRVEDDFPNNDRNCTVCAP